MANYDESEVGGLPGQPLRCVFEGRVEMSGQVVTVENRGTSLQWRRNSVFQRHVCEAKSRARKRG